MAPTTEICKERHTFVMKGLQKKTQCRFPHEEFPSSSLEASIRRDFSSFRIRRALPLFQTKSRSRESSETLESQSDSYSITIYGVYKI